MSKRPQFPNPAMPIDDRIALASTKLEMALDRAVELLHLNASNQLIMFTDRLSSQIPRSHAATAYRIFVHNLYWSEVAKLTSLWDSPGTDRGSIPTVIALINEPEIIDRLRERAVTRHQGGWTEDTDDPEIKAAMSEYSERISQEAGNEAILKAATAIAAADRVLSGDEMKAIRDFRNVRISHLLSEDAIVYKDLTANYGDETHLMNETIEIIEALNFAVRGSSFMWDDSREMARRDAEQLWGNCRFDIPRRPAVGANRIG